MAIKTFTVYVEKYVTRETETLAKVNHENIVKFIACESGGRYSKKILIMELCDGCLHDIIDPTGLVYSEFINVCEQLSNAIQCLWQNQIVHRDIKPENIMFVKRDAQTIYKLGDFGAARQLEPNQSYKSIYGTPEFMHPDTFAKYYARGLDSVDPNVMLYDTHDLWSIGVTLYNVATGQLPFNPKNGREDHQKMYKMMTNKGTKHISATEMDDGKITLSMHLPEHSLGIDNKGKVEEYLAGLLNVCSCHKYINSVFFCLIQTFLSPNAYANA